MKVKEKITKAIVQFNVTKTKIMSTGHNNSPTQPNTNWQEAVTVLIFLGSKISQEF